MDWIYHIDKEGPIYGAWALCGEEAPLLGVIKSGKFWRDDFDNKIVSSKKVCASCKAIKVKLNYGYPMLM